MAEVACSDCGPADNADAQASNLAEAGNSEAAYNPLDVTTFVQPTELPVPSITVEFCDRVSVHQCTTVSLSYHVLVQMVRKQLSQMTMLKQ